MMAAGMLTATSCTDFSDYNEVPAESIANGNKTLWENISQDPQLSDFAALVKRTGFDAQLNSSRFYTVWAPLNGTYNVADFQQLNDSALLAQFVKSHVAEYGHAASGKVDERIHTLNAKSFAFQGDGSYTFDGISISQPNLPGNNGLMHKLDGAAKFYPNLQEYLSMGSNIDSLRNYFMQYQITVLDQQASVKGPMVNGAQTYIDSVLITNNLLTRRLNARIENEDSSYTFVMPTDNAFSKMYDKVKENYKFITTTTVQDAESFTRAADSQTKTVTVNAAYLQDSLTRLSFVPYLIFSNNDAYNQWVVGKGLNTDTIRTTLRSKLSNPNDILEKYLVGQPQVMSNGYARIVDSLAFYPWETYSPELSIDPRGYLANLFPAAAKAYRNQTVPDSLKRRVYGPDVDASNYRYLWISPGGDRSKPDFTVLLPNVLSTTYNFYVVFMPSAMKEIADDPRPNKLNFELSYCNANGALASYKFSKEYADALQAGGELPKVPTALNMTTAFENNPEKLDTVFIGQFTFPVAYAGLSDYTFSPNIRVTSPISVFNNAQLSAYSRDVRIHRILMRPVELDEFEAKNK